MQKRRESCLDRVAVALLRLRRLSRVFFSSQPTRLANETHLFSVQPRTFFNCLRAVDAEGSLSLLFFGRIARSSLLFCCFRLCTLIDTLEGHRRGTDIVRLGRSKCPPMRPPTTRGASLVYTESALFSFASGNCGKTSGDCSVSPNLVSILYLDSLDASKFRSQQREWGEDCWKQ